MTKKKQFKSESYLMVDCRHILVMANSLNNMCQAVVHHYQFSHYPPVIKAIHEIHNRLFIASLGVDNFSLN